MQTIATNIGSARMKEEPAYLTTPLVFRMLPGARKHVMIMYGRPLHPTAEDDMAEPATLEVQNAGNGNGQNGPLVDALRDLLTLSKKEGKERIRSLPMEQQLELLDLVRASLSVSDDADQVDDDFVDTYSNEVTADWKWTREQYNAGAFDDVPGQYVAVAHKERLGSGPFPDVLKDEVAAKTGLPPERLVIFYIDDGSWSR
jgi:hypothetical protein